MIPVESPDPMPECVHAANRSRHFPQLLLLLLALPTCLLQTCQPTHASTSQSSLTVTQNLAEQFASSKLEFKRPNHPLIPDSSYSFADPHTDWDDDYLPEEDDDDEDGQEDDFAWQPAPVSRRIAIADWSPLPDGAQLLSFQLNCRNFRDPFAARRFRTSDLLAHHCCRLI